MCRNFDSPLEKVDHDQVGFLQNNYVSLFVIYAFFLTPGVPGAENEIKLKSEPVPPVDLQFIKYNLSLFPY